MQCHFLNIWLLPPCIEFAQSEVATGTKIGQRPFPIAMLDTDARKPSADHKYTVWILTLAGYNRLLATTVLALALERDVPIK